ncbi:MAG: bifunctional phosphoribosylaminoimidazolecarboxamide formyltransferase/inosine monophosphate cyclohydrolase [Chloroflexi bacterium]|nr:bifunctional phosphoribosylaminoimidazolecarboxamide formyltransferase/inosine monophosphate cyclohydrolase [Chloroflexota bacterium]
MRALISVYEKEGITEFAKFLVSQGYQVFSTGGTLKFLDEEGVLVENISDITGFPEILDGRVKTLHPKVYAGILSISGNEDHEKELRNLHIEKFDLVVNNLYPFEKIADDKNSKLEYVLENIDIGGPSMIRAAAKNFSDVIVVVDNNDYSLITDLILSKSMSYDKRKYLAYKAFDYVSKYDNAIAKYFQKLSRKSTDSNSFPDQIKLNLMKVRDLRYGENPHQKGALYKEEKESGIISDVQLNGPEMSYCNYIDAEAAIKSVNAFKKHSVSIIKHANPCGLAFHEDQSQAFNNAIAGDPVSAFGGIVGFNSEVEEDTAILIRKFFFEVIVAPGYTKKSLTILKQKKKLRILKSISNDQENLILRSLSGNFLIQQQDSLKENWDHFNIVTEKDPSEVEIEDLKFANKVCSFVKSNAIVLVKNNHVIGIGAGQPNRLNSVKIACDLAGKNSQGSVLASDAFFPFADGLEIAIKFGVKSVIQPGGSIRDNEIISEANKAGISMIMTGRRHFLH